MFLLQERRKQADDVLAQFVLALQPRVQVRAIVDKSVVEDLRLGGNAGTEFFYPRHQTVESPLRLGQWTIGLRSEGQSDGLFFLRQFVFK